jgi:long-chain acyl-CoA synthetase
MTNHHLSALVHHQAEKYGEKIALKYRDYDTAQWVSVFLVSLLSDSY